MSESVLASDLIQFPEGRKYDMILLGRVAIDFNPVCS